MARLHLNDLERAILAQTTRKKVRQHASEPDADYSKRIANIHRLHTGDEKAENLGLLLFVGLGELYGYGLVEIRDFLGLEDGFVRILRDGYTKHMGQAVSLRHQGLMLDSGSTAGKLYSKMRLVQSYIRFNHSECLIVS